MEIQVWRIGNSDSAPRFEVIVEPNEVVLQAIGAAQEPSEKQQLYVQFWTAVRSGIEKTGKFPSLRSPRGQSWYDVALGRSGVHLQLAVNNDEVRVGVYLRERVAQSALGSLLRDKEIIEREIGELLEWDPNPEARDKVIKLRRAGQFADTQQRDGLVSWLVERAGRFRDVFGPRIANLQLYAEGELANVQPTVTPPE